MRYALQQRTLSGEPIADMGKIDKLNKLTNISTFWHDVRKLVGGTASDHSISRWQCLAEYRENELLNINN